MIVRRATLADAPALTDCFVAAYAPFQSLELPPVTEGLAADIAENFVWLAEEQGHVMGGIVVTLGAHAHIANLAVHPKAARQGVGRALIAQARSAAMDAGHRVLHLATHAKMTATQEFYRKSGWVKAGRDGDKVYFQMELAAKDSDL